MLKTQKLWRLFTIAALLASLLNLPAHPARAAYRSLSLTNFSIYSQNFDSIGTAAVATLPADWKVDKLSSVRTVGTYAAALTATNYSAGDNMSSSASNGIYNYGAGDPATATDRAIGFISSGTATWSGNLYALFNNGTGSDLASLTLSYNVEKYRMGTNSAGFSVQLYYSLDGSTWTSAGPNFLTSFPADGETLGYTPAPGETVSVSNQVLTVPIPSGSDFYLAWNYSVTSGTYYSYAQGLGIDDVSMTPTPALPALSINDVSAPEGDSDTTNFTFTATLSYAAPAGGVTFDVLTSDGTATAGSDYTSYSATGVSIAEGATSTTIDVPVNGDVTFEPDETFNVTLGSVSTNAVLGDGTGLGTIQNDDPAPPVLSINNITRYEGNSGTYNFAFVVSLDKPAPAGGVSFDITTADDTATVADGDYVANTPATVTIPQGSSSYSFPVTVNGDTAVESTEIFYVDISNVTGATVGDDQGAGTITNDDGAIPLLSINDVTLTEGDSGTTDAIFTVSLDFPALAGGVTFDIATADGTATTADSDYVLNSATGVTILEGIDTASFTVTVNGDAAFEPDETFTVNLTSVTGANLGDGTGLGTINNDDLPPPNLSINDVTLTEGNNGTSIASFTVSLDAVAPAGGVTFDIATADGTASSGSDYVAGSVNGVTITSGNTTYTFDVTINGDWNNETNETFFVNVTGVTGAVVTDAQALGTLTNDDPVITPIYTLQGNGAVTPFSGTWSTTGVVVGDYEGGVTPQIRGFYIQDPTGDANVTTSDGLFIYNGVNNNVALGDLVRVTGTLYEYQGQTQISATLIEIISSGNTIVPTDISLPFASTAAPEQYEGMLVRVPQTLYVTEIYLLGRFNQVTLSGSGRLFQPTNLVLPGAPAIAMQATNNLNKIILDDALNTENPDPIVFGRGGLPLSASNTLRGGDTITNLVGVFTYTYGGNSTYSPNAYRIRPVDAQSGSLPNFIPSNARPSAPPVVGGTLKVVGMNLLNYFNTFDDGNSGTPGCYPSGGDSDCRGANDAAEFTRQSDKLVNAILALDADALGIAEIENDGYDSVSAIQDLVNKLNAVAGAGTYAFINPDTVNGSHSLGTDAIKVGILYKPARVTPVGTTAVLNSTAFVNGGDAVPRNRPSLLQAFQTADGARFLLNVNHLKSKGSACTVPDALDGQGNCNIVRTNAVNALLAWFATNPTGTGDPDILVVGDLNAYALEDPVRAFKAAPYNFTDMLNAFGGAAAYSYVFDGQWGYLDHALGSPSLFAQTTSAAEWHINSDEPSVLDYDTQYKTPGQIISLYSSDPIRTSDHDPILVGLNLDAIAPTVTSSMLASPDPSSRLTVNFTVTFSEAVTNVGTADFAVVPTGITGAYVSAVSGSGATRTVTVRTGTGNGTLRLDVPLTATITDLAGNALTALPYTGDQAYTINKVLVYRSTGTQDGYILESGETTNVGGTVNSTLTTLRLGDDAAKKQYRDILSFATTSLPDNAVITKVTLKVRKQAVIGGGDPITTFQGFMLDIRKGPFGTAVLQTTDFQAAGNRTIGPFKPALVGGWYEFNLTSLKAYINKLATLNGLTQIRLRFKLDDNNNTIANYLSLYSGNAALATRPTLTVEYYVP